MSLEKLKDVMRNITAYRDWSLQLLKITTSKRTGVGYISRQISLHPPERLATLIADISNLYLGSGKKSLEVYQSVADYDGTANSLTIYKLKTDNPLIIGEYASFLQAIADPNEESDPFQYTTAYLLKGQIFINGEDVPVKLVSMQNPVTILKHKFLHSEGSFVELSSNVLSLRPVMDVVIVGDTVYLLSLAGENLFNMERSYKAVCSQKIALIEQTGILHGFEIFKSIAQSGHNPRRFVAFNEARLTSLQRKNTRVSMARQFAIPLDPTGEIFDATIEGAADKIVRLLCNRGMIDPFEKSPVEVDGARKWQ